VQDTRPINPGNHLAFPEISHDVVDIIFGNLKGEPLARTAPVQSEHQPWAFIGAPIGDGINAKCPMITMDEGWLDIRVWKVRAPHQ